MPSYAVIRIVDHFGSVRFEAVPASQVRGRTESLQAAYLRAFKAWKEKPDSGRRPQKFAIRVWEVKTGWDAQAVARARAAHYQKRHDCSKSKGKEDPQEESETGK